MKKVMLLTIFAALMMISSAAVAQTTASGTLTVTATVKAPLIWFSTLTLPGWRFPAAREPTPPPWHFGNVSAFGAISAAYRPYHNRQQLYGELRG